MRVVGAFMTFNAGCYGVKKY